MAERYQIGDKIGQGGLGAVFRAFDTQLKRDVALKRLLPADEGENGGASEAEADNLINEATTLSALQHPNIVTVYDVGRDDSGAFVVMELLKGETFDTTVERGALNEKDFRNVVSQTMEALLAAHHAGIIHRDLKPSNLMVNWLPSGKFQIKILDFGLAKFSKAPSVQTADQTDSVLGSIYFMAPEQFERVPLDARTDLYSMGSLYHYCLTGQFPFNGDSAAQVMAAHLQNRVAPLHELRPDLPKWMCDWVMWLISREIGDRPESAQQALDYFQEERSGRVMPVADAPPPVAPIAPHAAAPPPAGAPGYPMPGHQPLLPKKPGFKPPVWAMITVPLLLGTMLVIFLTKMGAKRKLDERNEIIASLNAAEIPKGDAQIVDTFFEFIADQESDTMGKANVNGAFGTLARLQGDEVDDALVAYLPKVSSRHRANLIGAIITRGVGKAIPELIKYVDSKSDKVSDAAIYAISVLGDEKNLGRLLRELENPASDAIKKTLSDAIITIAQRNPDLEKRSSRILTALQGSSGEYRYTLLRILGYLGGDEAWQELNKVLASNNQDARKAALLGLSNWPDGRPLKVIYNIARNEKDPLIRNIAFRSAVALMTANSELPEERRVELIGELMKVENVSGTERKNLLGALATMAVPEAKVLAESLKEDQRLGAFGEMAAEQVTENLTKLQMVVQQETRLETKKAIVNGESDFRWKREVAAVVGWTNPAYNVAWPVRFAGPGSYSVSATFAVPNGEGGSFALSVAGARLAAKTGVEPEIHDAQLGELEVKAAGTYRLEVVGVAIDIRDAELMHLRSVTLTRK